MSGNAKNAIMVAVGLLAFMIILPPAIIGGTSGAAWVFIKDYQTLLTGLLAILAAWITVWQMRSSDALQLRMHRQLLYVSQRRELLASHRLADSLQPALRSFAAAIDKMKGETESAVLMAGWTWDAKLNWFLAVQQLEYLLKCLDNVDGEQKVLFTQPLKSEFDVFSENIRFVRNEINPEGRNLADLYPRSDHAPLGFTQDGRDLLVQFPRKAEMLADSLEAWMNQLLRDID